ncbi:metalloendoproteinase 3-MMP-like [Cannabis sativa]|uniref:metalloendoproteinase 3-MMP-like n=1 Tax=Cannabis sativa TaxID=3483 RepID=UPI0029C9DB55|nr:metalloendoproteinase 3-MMP-like [Cannabis sativa]
MMIIKSSSSSSSPFDFLKNLQGCKKGDNVQGIRDLKNYLKHFGYFTKHSTNHIDDEDDFDYALEKAIKTYQINYNLKPTGILDPKTLFKMMKPRCGVPDIFAKNKTRMRSANKSTPRHHHIVSHYSFFQGEPKWPATKFNLTYTFLNGTPTEAVSAVGRAFNTWASNTQFTFFEAQNNEKADITVSFERRNHGDGDPFDGAGGTLAHAFSPPDGRVHFDAEESWAIGPVAEAYDVETVALHEIGHILGLQHSSVEGAIMYPEIGAGITKGLHGDDIQGINALYNLV